MAGTSSSSIRPRVLLTRRIPSSAFELMEAALRRRAQRSAGPLLAGRAEAPARRQGRPDLASSPTRSPRTCSTPAPKLKVVANIAVGYDNIDVAAAKVTRHRRDEHARRPHRGGRGAHVGADLRDHPAPRRRRSSGAARRLEGLGARLHAGQRARRQAAGHHRPRADRAGRRGQGAGVRHARRVRRARRTGRARTDELSLDELLVSSDVDLDSRADDSRPTAT